MHARDGATAQESTGIADERVAGIVAKRPSHSLIVLDPVNEMPGSSHQLPFDLCFRGDRRVADASPSK